MAHTFSGNHVLGSLNAVGGAVRESAVIVTIDPAYTYTTGGITNITAANLGLSNILFCAPFIFSTGHWGVYVPGTKAFKVFSAAGTELASASAALQGATVLLQAGGN